jgi:hypothetical protein
MKITTDSKQRIQSIFTFLLEFYKVVMGSFLTVFVPQECDGHMCTMYETVQNEMACFIFNVVSCLTLVRLYFIELRRENWCIEYLDIDPAKSNDNLDKEIEEYPEFKKIMKTINEKYRRNALICIAFQIVNITMSIVYISFHWAGSVAVTPLIGYIILMCSKLYNTRFISNASLVEERAYSAYLTISRTYNTIDEDHKKKINIEIT